MSKPTFVYCIGPKRRGPVKIGVTTDVAFRLKFIQSLSPVPVFVHGVIDGDFDTERDLHQRFRHLRKHGEWFEVDDELKGFIREATRKWVEPPNNGKRIRRSPFFTTLACSSHYKTWVCEFIDFMDLTLLQAVHRGLCLLAADEGVDPPPDCGPSLPCQRWARESQFNVMTIKSHPDWRAWLNDFSILSRFCLSDLLRKSLARLARDSGFEAPPHR